MKAMSSEGNFLVRHWVAVVVIAAVVLGTGGAAVSLVGCGNTGSNNATGTGQKLDEIESVGNKQDSNLAEKIVFERGNKIWIMNPDGTDQKQLTFDGYDSYPSLSPDGKEVVFTRFTSDPTAVSTSTTPGPTRELYIIEINGENARRLSPSSWATSEGWTPMFDVQEGTKWRKRDCLEPSFSGDGGSICFVISDFAYQEIPGGAMGNYGLTGIAVMEMDSDEPAGIDIVCHGNEQYGGESFGNPKFSKDGSELFFSYGTGGGPGCSSVEKINVDGTNREAIFPYKFDEGTGLGKGYCAYDLSPDGNTMVCAELTYDMNRFRTWLFLADTDGSKRRNVPTEAETFSIEGVSFSTDGLRIVFAKGCEMGGTEQAAYSGPTAFVVNADGNGLTQIASDANTPDWGKTAE